MSTRIVAAATRPGKFVIGMPVKSIPYAARFGRLLLDVLVIWTAGNLIGLIFWTLVAARVIRVKGYSRLIRSAWQGGLIVAANHPTMIETLLIPGMGWPWMLFSRRFLFWSVPDHHLLPKGFKWIHPLLRGIAIDRKLDEPERNKNAVTKMIAILRGPNTLIIHVEGGRTFKWEERGVKLLQEGDRQLSEIKLEVLTVAKRPKAWILPLYIDMSPGRQEKRDYLPGAKALLQPGLGPIVFNFDHLPYKATLSPEQEKERLEQLLLKPRTSEPPI